MKPAVCGPFAHRPPCLSPRGMWRPGRPARPQGNIIIIISLLLNDARRAICPPSCCHGLPACLLVCGVSAHRIELPLSAFSSFFYSIKLKRFVCAVYFKQSFLSSSCMYLAAHFLRKVPVGLPPPGSPHLSRLIRCCFIFPDKGHLSSRMSSSPMRY
jgi:hypothetical protein